MAGKARSTDRVGGPLSTPYTWESTDFAGNRIGLIVDFDNTTREIDGGTGYRDENCQHKRIYLGVGLDGTPNGSTRFINVASGSQNLGKGQFTGAGFNVIEDLIAIQITAGP